MILVQTPLISAYSDALLNAADNAGVGDQVAEQAEALENLFSSNQKLKIFYEAPNVAGNEKEDLIVKVIGGQFHPLVVNLVRMLIRRGRLTLLLPVLRNVHQMHLFRRGIRQATIETAVELSTEDKKRLFDGLTEFTGYNLKVTWTTDPTLIGGVRFQCGDMLIDTTLRLHLDRLRSQLLKTKVV